MTYFSRSRLAIVGLALVGACAASPSWGQVTTTYVYDAQGQVTSVVRPSQTIGYTYDLAANRTALTASGGAALRSAPAAQSASAQTSTSSPADANASELQRLVEAARAAAHQRAAPIFNGGAAATSTGTAAER